MRYLRRAAELTADPGDRATLLDRAGRAALRANAPTEARELLEGAHELIAADDAQPAALVTARLAELDWLEGHPQRAVARLEPALEPLAGPEFEAQFAEVAGQLGRFLILNGEFDRGAVYVEQAHAIAELLDLPDVLSHSLNSKATVAVSAGRPNEARILLDGALAIALEHDLHAAALRAFNNLGWVLETLDRLGEANDVSRRAAEYARRVGDRGNELNFIGGSLYSLHALGEWDEVLARAEEIVDAAVIFQTQSSMLDVLYTILARGDLESARTWFERLTAGAEPEDPQSLAVARAVEATLLRAEGATREALALADLAFAERARNAITTLHSKLAAEAVLECALELGERAKAEELLTVLDGLRPAELTPLYRGLRGRFRGRLDEGPAAWAHFLEAEAAYEGLGAPFHLAVTRLEHAESLASAGRSDEARALRAVAREVFERLGATPWVERAGAVEAGERVSA